MPKANTNTARCRKLEIVWLLGRQHAMSAVQIAKKMRMDVSSVRRYLMELREEKKVFRRYQLRGEYAKRPTFYYCLRRDGI